MKVLVHILLDVLKLTIEACSKHSPTPFPCLWEQNSDSSSVGNGIQAMMTQRAWRCKEHVTKVCP